VRTSGRCALPHKHERQIPRKSTWPHGTPSGGVRDNARCEQLGARVIPSPDEAGVLRFRDLDGISLELKAV
jgi:hypothetical protein